MVIGIDVRLWTKTGVGRYIRNLVLNLQKIDNKNSYVLFALPQDAPKIRELVNNPKFKIAKVNILWHTISEQFMFSKVLEKENLDLMHFPYFSVPAYYKKPFVVTIHDLIMNHFATGKASTKGLIKYYFKYLAYKYVVKNAIKNSVKVIVPSNATKEEIMEHLKVIEDKIAVTPEGANDQIIYQNKQFTAQNLVTGKYFLYVGNAYPHKNLDLLKDAFELFKIENHNASDFKLVLVGEMDYFYKRLKAKTLSEDIIFFGYANDEELNNLYKNAYALVQPSLMEGFGLPVLEAMANKLLVICSDIPSLKEVVESNALYFDPKNAVDLKNKLAFSLENTKNNQELISKAFLRSKEFSWEKMAKETLKVYEQCVL